MAFTATQAQREDEPHMDRTIDVGEALARLDADLADLRRACAPFVRGAPYVTEGSTARRIVAGERGRR